MNTFIIVAAVIFGVLGIVGSVIPALPGPPLSWLGLLLIYFSGGGKAGEPMSTSLLMIWLAVTIAVTILDYIVPMWFTKLTGGSKAAGWGALIGLIAGMFIPPIGIILGTLLGAFVAELVFAGKSAVSSAASAFGALLGFVFGTGMKLIACGLMFYNILVYL